MKKTLMLMMVAVAGIVMADADVDALKAVLEKVADPETQYRIGNCYFEGKVVAKDKAEAVRWFRKAADQGYADAQCWLGKWYTYHLTIGEKSQGSVGTGPRKVPRLWGLSPWTFLAICGQSLLADAPLLIEHKQLLRPVGADEDVALRTHGRASVGKRPG